jgi:hypothetical protein
MLTETTPVQDQLSEIFRLRRYAPNDDVGSTPTQPSPHP